MKIAEKEGNTDQHGTVVLVCDSLKGLLRVELASGLITVLANAVDWSGGASGPSQGAAGGINYANDLDVAEDGTIYFSSSTAGVVAQHPDGYYDTMRSFLLNMCAGDHTGRLLKRDRATGRTSEVLSGLWYANGVVLAHDSQSVLVVETMGRVFSSFSAIFNREMQKLPLFSCILI